MDRTSGRLTEFGGRSPARQDYGEGLGVGSAGTVAASLLTRFVGAAL